MKVRQNTGSHPDPLSEMLMISASELEDLITHAANASSAACHANRTREKEAWVQFDAIVEHVKANPASSLKAGMTQAVWVLRNAANTHEAEAALSKKVVESEGHTFAARVLRSYANGLEMDAENLP